MTGANREIHAKVSEVLWKPVILNFISVEYIWYHLQKATFSLGQFCYFFSRYSTCLHSCRLSSPWLIILSYLIQIQFYYYFFFFSSLSQSWFLICNRAPWLIELSTCRHFKLPVPRAISAPWFYSSPSDPPTFLNPYHLWLRSCQYPLGCDPQFHLSLPRDVSHQINNRFALKI